MDVIQETHVDRRPAVALARIYGEPIHQLPLDLYIPPDALEIMLDAFEGPLDLLLYLIRKANIDILDIPMAPLTAQYLEYVENMRTRNLELAGEYLLMAAMLIEIKSRLLLPRPKIIGTEDDNSDPRAELVRRLIEYEQIKLAAQTLDALPQAGRDFYWIGIHVEYEAPQRQPNVSIGDLNQAWLGILRQARLKQHHRIDREELSVREHMGIILRYLHSHSGSCNDFIEFYQLLKDNISIAELIVHFIALLELAREQTIDFTQSAPFAPIYVRLFDAERS